MLVSERILLRVTDDNPRAQRVYETCDVRLAGRLHEARYHQGQWRDTLVMGILKREFLATSSGTSAS